MNSTVVIWLIIFLKDVHLDEEKLLENIKENRLNRVYMEEKYEEII